MPESGGGPRARPQSRDRILQPSNYNVKAPGHGTHLVDNLLAEPGVALEIRDGERIRTITALAAPAEGEERERLFARILREAPGFADYQRRTTRVLPVVVLDPVESRLVPLLNRLPEVPWPRMT
jgi:hypothetical protein